jgi:hypothetical protein
MNRKSSCGYATHFFNNNLNFLLKMGSNWFSEKHMKLKNPKIILEFKMTLETCDLLLFLLFKLNRLFSFNAV